MALSPAIRPGSHLVPRGALSEPRRPGPLSTTAAASLQTRETSLFPAFKFPAPRVRENLVESPRRQEESWNLASRLPHSPKSREIRCKFLVIREIGAGARFDSVCFLHHASPSATHGAAMRRRHQAKQCPAPPKGRRRTRPASPAPSDTQGLLLRRAELYEAANVGGGCGARRYP